MECLVVDFVQFFCAIAQLLFLERRLATKLSEVDFEFLLKFRNFLRS